MEHFDQIGEMLLASRWQHLLAADAVGFPLPSQRSNV
jgi:hypothetical protein